MATEKILNTRLKLRYDSHENWLAKDPVLMTGEVAISTVSVKQDGNVNFVPSVLMKVGDNTHKYSELDFIYAKSADVLEACKTEAGLTKFVQDVLAGEGMASDEVVSALAGRMDTAEGKVSTLEGKMTAVEGKAAANESAIATIEGRFAADTVAAEITAAINALNLANTYEAKGEAAKVQGALDTYKTSNDAAVQKNATDIAGEISRAKAAEEANANAIAAIKDGTTLDSFADVETALAGKETSGAAAQALVDAKAYADGLAGNYDAKGAAATAESNAKAYAKEYADGLAGNYDAAGSAGQALTDAKAYTDSEMTRLVGSKTVNAQITEYVTGLKLGETYDAKGAASAAEAAAKSHADGLNTAMNTRVEALEAIDHDHENKGVLDGITAEKVTAWDAAEQNAKDYADDLDEAMDLRMQAIEAKFGEGEGNVEAQIAAAVAAEAKLREDADTALDNKIKAITDDYLKAADKTALQDQITENAGAIADLETLVGTTPVTDQITAVTNPLAARVKAVEDDYLKAADKTELEGKITANANAIELLTNGVSAEEVDGVNDLIQYVKDHGTEVTGMKKDIKDNADAIDAIEADYLKAADKTELSGLITGLDTRMGAAETAIGTKAAQADLETLAGRVTTAEGKITTLEGEMDSAEGRLEALEGLTEGKKVSVAIEEAVTALKNGQLTTMQGEIDAVEDRATALEGKSHEHSNKTVLDGITAGHVTAWDAAVQTVTAAAGSGLKATKTGTDVAIELDDTIVWVLDCGGAGV